MSPCPTTHFVVEIQTHNPEMDVASRINAIKKRVNIGKSFDINPLTSDDYSATLILFSVTFFTWNSTP